MNARRLETDAKIVLTNAGYIVKYRGYALDVYKGSEIVETLHSRNGTVNNEPVEALLKIAKK